MDGGGDEEAVEERDEDKGSKGITGDLVELPA